MLRRPLLLLCLSTVAFAQAGRNYGRSVVISQQGIAATSQVLASQAGAYILAKGGSAVDAAIAVLEKVGATPWANRATSELNTVRKLVTRMGVVSRTDFLAPGYALLETLTTLVIGLLLVARFKYPLAEGLLVGFVTLIRLLS